MSAISKIVQAHRLGLEPHKSLCVFFDVKVLRTLAYRVSDQHFHSNPEFSFLEKATARTIRSHLAKLQVFRVFPEIGGYGLAAVFENGPGKTVLRADIDRLPVE
jgi:metal-dependent amidase/aminoacylase/carboxypeptidase family protein